MKKSSWNRYFLLLVSTIILLLSGCGEEETEEVTPTKMKNNNVNQAEQLMEEKVEAITEAVAIKEGENLYAAADVKHTSRFNLEKIRKEAHSLLKKRWPNDTVRFSTDKKVVLELRKLKEDMAQTKMKKKEKIKRLNNIEDLMKG
ncbi:hypothetical protein D7Z54_05685 [Salibacterium salarium]|uniref:Sporulation lipoprotein YhcN/YlaJ (Spore_YhcN_YlaJ) n=1 Tax=Salibacterium salarium TaxID=284579 RepID=A0A3R9WVV0_9BACI|nr:hypothetical protein [Salibacterium salarium]RSL34630.1 hypothetical protein D7Z54_05685 [Salibacterium salarium]